MNTMIPGGPWIKLKDDHSALSMAICCRSLLGSMNPPGTS